jgi:hypothetical protein
MDVAYRDTTTYLGEQTSKVAVLKPTANSNDGYVWTAGDATCNATPANCWQQQDEAATFDTTTYGLSASTSNALNFAMLEMTDSSTAGIGASDTIHGVEGMIMVREETALATARVQTRLVSGVATSSGTNINQTTTYFPAMLEAFVDPATAVAWVPSGLDNVSMGCYETINSTGRHRCTATQVYVFYTPAVVTATDLGEFIISDE